MKKKNKPMKKHTLIFQTITLFFIIGLKSFAIDLKDWDSATLAKCNTAQLTNNLSDEEKNIILYINLARTNGEKFWANVAEPYIIKNKIKKSSYTESLKKELRKLNPLPVLQHNQVLFEIAKDYAIESGQKNWVGHKNFEKRYKPASKEFNLWGENCAYGYNQFLDIVMQLLIDEGIKNLGHRKNILHPEFTHIGISIQPHERYRYNCVQSFGKK